MELRVCTGCQRVVPGETHCPECGKALTLASPDFFLGRSFGKYNLEKVLGVGGMGVVYLAEQRTLLRKVALKLVLPQHDDTVFRRRFLREARVLAELRHPNIVEVFDFDVNEWGLPFYVMEYLEGQTLREMLEERGRLKPTEVVGIMREVAAGLGSVHRHGIVHRDLKPENIFLADFDGGRVAKVLDFGIAKAQGPGNETHLTQTGLVVGTINYLAPEQLLDGAIGPATDQYALALVVAELLTGKAVRAGKTMARIISEEIDRPADVQPLVGMGFHKGFSDAIKRATAPDPGMRFTDIEAFIDSVGIAAEGHSESDDGLTIASSAGQRPKGGIPTVSDRPSRTSRTPSTEVPFRHWWIAAAVVFALVIVTSVFFAFRYQPASGEGARVAMLDVEREIPVALDVNRILSYRNEILTLGGMGGLILQEEVSDLPPTRLSIDPKAILGVTPDGFLVIREADEVLLRESDGGESESWADGLPAGVEVTASPDTRFLVSRIENGLNVFRLDFQHFRQAFSIELGYEAEAVGVGNRLLVIVGGGRLQVWSLDEQVLKYDQPFTELSVTALAVNDDADLVAVGGWFDHVVVIDISEKTSHRIPRRQGATQDLDLIFLPAGRTLAIGERGGITLWRPGDGVIDQWDHPDSDISDMCVDSGRLLALDRKNHMVLVLSLGGMTSGQVVDFGEDNAWTAVADPTGPRVLVGTQTGLLYAIDLETDEVTHHTVHTQGITSLVTDGKRLASASDDKTIAVWRLPQLTVEWRSRAHGFLINQLFLNDTSQTLWSTSSDHSLKRWSWPDLEELETVRTEDIVGEALSLGALWVSPDERRVFLGTWNRKVLLLKRQADGPWTGRAFPFDSFGGYVIADLGDLEAVMMAGVQQPFGLVVYDFESDRLLRLRGANRNINCLVSVDDGRRVLAFGDHEILDFRFRRSDDGMLHYSMALTQHHDLGVSSAATLLSESRVAVANDRGVLHVISIDDIDGLVLCDVVAGLD